MAASSTTTADPLRHDFEFSELNIPLKDARIVSLSALEDGDEEFQGGNFRSRKNLLERLLMSIRRRRGGREPLPAHEPLRLPHEKEELLKKGFRHRWRKHGVRIGCAAVPVFVLCFFGIVHIANVIMSMVPVVWDDDDHSFLPNWGRPGELGEGLASYPTDFTRDVTPIMCHSHNDYWRRVPLYQALHYGCTGVEADVWLFDNELFVGHNTMSLTRNRTFRSLYVDPLVQILDQQNTLNEFTTPENNTKNGVFDKDPSQTLVLLVDFKNSGEDIYPVVVEQLSILREKGYLTYFDGRTVLQGPITVVATGNAPFNLLTANTTYRDIFFDAPLSELYEEPIGGFPASGSYHSHPPKFSQSSGSNAPIQPQRMKRNSGQGTVGTDDSSVFDLTNSYYASVSFGKSIGMIWGGRLSPRQMKLIRGQIQGAKRRGLKVRYWNTPQWPIGLRNHVWRVLVREGVDYLNGDDLAAMTKMNWRMRKHHGWFSQ